MEFTEWIELASRAMDAAGVVIIVFGFALASLGCARRLAAHVDRHDAFVWYRQSIGRSILLGLEVLVAADIIRTVAVSSSFESVGILAVVVLIRTFLSLTLEVELTGRWPWQHEPRQQEPRRAPGGAGA